MLVHELTLVFNAYLLAGTPIGLVMLAGIWSPVYRQPWPRLARWWSLMALVFVVAAIAVSAAAG
jgi:hypothetical protein